MVQHQSSPKAFRPPRERVNLFRKGDVTGEFICHEEDIKEISTGQDWQFPDCQICINCQICI